MSEKRRNSNGKLAKPQADTHFVLNDVKSLASLAHRNSIHHHFHPIPEKCYRRGIVMHIHVCSLPKEHHTEQKKNREAKKKKIRQQLLQKQRQKQKRTPTTKLIFFDFLRDPPLVFCSHEILLGCHALNLFCPIIWFSASFCCRSSGVIMLSKLRIAWNNWALESFTVIDIDKLFQ